MTFAIVTVLTIFTLLVGGAHANLGLNADALTSQSSASTQAAPPNPRFRPVAGSSLSDRLQAALAQGRSDSASHFWAAYAFSVRPGMTIDLEVRCKDGKMMTVDGVNIDRYTQPETRNLGIFLLYQREAASPDRVEIYNLDRVRDYDNYPVYWLGRAADDESFGLLQGLLRGQPSSWVAERTVAAVAVHEDPRAGDLLEAMVRTSQVAKVRETAALWLGLVTDRLPFLAGVVRDENASNELRKQAAMAIGLNRSATAVPTLTGLFDEVRTRDVRNQVLVAAAIHGEHRDAADDDAVVDFLIRVAENEPDREARRQAIFWLGQKAGERSLKALEHTVDGPDDEVKEQAVFAISQRPKDEAVPLLMRIAREHPNFAVRKKAIFWLGQIDDERVVPFLKQFLTGSR